MVGDVHKNSDDFLFNFIEQERYLQNSPLSVDHFIKFCKKRGVITQKKELEFFEKEKLLFPIMRFDRPLVEGEQVRFKKPDGRELHMSAGHALQEGEIKIENYIKRTYSNISFAQNNKSTLKQFVEEGYLFSPAEKDLWEPWDSFFGEKDSDHVSERVLSFYSSFQIYWLRELKRHFTYTVNLACDNVSIKPPFIFAGNRAKIEIDERTEERTFSWLPLRDEEAVLLREECVKFDIFLKFLLSVQSVYFHYIQSGGGRVQLSISDEKLKEITKNFKLEGVLEELSLSVEDVVEWYRKISSKSQDMLGIKGADWVQLLKNISWDKKDKLEDDVRLGIDYLQWAVMLKRIIEEYLEREILDIDEIGRVDANHILKVDPNEVGNFSIRYWRNRNYKDGKKDFLHDRHRRLFYLANDFLLSYHPRLMVFVEGKTEQVIFSNVFKKYFNSSDNRGIEFLDIGGVDQLFGAKVSARFDGRADQKFVTNFKHLVTYNVNKWQVIPFVVVDDESEVYNLLQKEKFIALEGKDYPIPRDWQYVWGQYNKNRPYEGKNFEMANFSNEEMAKVLTDVLEKQVDSSVVEDKRVKGFGIKQVIEETEGVEYDKVKIAEKLFDNLFDEYENSKNDEIFERPIFKVLRKILHLAIKNRSPVDTRIERENKQYYRKILAGKRNL